MNILIAVPWYKPQIGGVVGAVEKLSRELYRQNQRPVILTGGQSCRAHMIDDDNGIPVYGMELRPLFDRRRRLKSLLGFIAYLWPTMKGLKELVDRESIDIINISYPLPGHIYVYLLHRFFSKKYIITFHGSDFNAMSALPWSARRCLDIIVDGADAIVAVSQEIYDGLGRRYPKKVNHLHLVNSAIDPEWAEVIPRQKYQIEGKYMLSLAVARPVKGQDILIEAWALIADRYPEIKLVIAGAGSRDEDYDLLIEQRGLKNRVIKLGRVEHDDLPPLLEKCLFGVIPSRNEGLPIAALEFGLMRKAVVATAVGGIPELIADGFNGRLVPAEDFKALAETVEYCLANPGQVDMMGENAYRRVMERHTVDNMAGRYMDIYRGCAGVNR